MPIFRNYTDGVKRTILKIDLPVDHQTYEAIKKLEKLGVDWRAECWAGALHQLECAIHEHDIDSD